MTKQILPPPYSGNTSLFNYVGDFFASEVTLCSIFEVCCDNDKTHSLVRMLIRSRDCFKVMTFWKQPENSFMDSSSYPHRLFSEWNY